MGKVITEIVLPHHIIRKSRTYFYDVVRQRYIHKDNINVYITGRRERDARIQRLRWDLNTD